MSVEQIARDLEINMANPVDVKGMITADALANGGALPQHISMIKAMKMMAGLMGAFPDVKSDVRRSR